MKIVKQFVSHFPKQHAKVLGVLLLILGLSQVFIQEEPLRHTITLDLTEKRQYQSSPTIDQSDVGQGLSWREETVKSGDSLSGIFSRMDVSATVLYRLLNSSSRAQALKDIFPGHRLRFGFDSNNELAALQYLPSRLESLEFTADINGQFSFDYKVKQPDIQLVYKQAVIEDSLFLAGQNAGVSQTLIMNIADIFSGVIDFVYDPRKGDSFSVLYEEQYLDGEKIANGNILAAVYTNAGETYKAYRYEFQNGESGYFNEKGLSMRKAFLRAPLDFARISSGFNLRRFHPVHKKIRAHRGTDYVAPTGTPVYAAGDGRVWKSGFSRANGNYVFIKHGEAYITKYLHLHKRYVKSGQKVKQREIIGTVGSTGYSTGPHLHYEFLVNGVHRNPRTILNKLPTAKPVPKTERNRFDQQLYTLQQQFDTYQTIALQ